VSFHPAIDGVTTLASADGCAPEPIARVAPDNVDVTIQTWVACAGNSQVVFVTVAGAGHAWMGHAGRPAAEALVGPPYRDFDSSAAIWEFLAAHPR
jgi:poly(3-hydroxybutyrate) depolymerase